MDNLSSALQLGGQGYGLGQRLAQLIPQAVAVQQNSQGSSTQSIQPATILPDPVQVTQQAGNYNPGLEVFSGGVARDTNFAADEGTPVKLPPGQWQIQNQYDGDNGGGQGYRGGNLGYGNAILATNVTTGDRLHFIHLGKVNTKLGQFMNGGDTIGQVGQTGNATGANLGVEYYDQKGNLGSFMNSPYAQYMNIKS